MDSERRERLAKRLRNSSRFLWGVVAGKQEDNYRWLERDFITRQPGEAIPGHLKGSYGQVTNLLLERYGIERIARFLEEEVKRNIDKDLLDYLRECWHDGRRPRIEDMEKYHAYRRYANPFLQTKGRTKTYRDFDSLITALVEINPQPISNTPRSEYRMSVGGFADFSYVLFQELEAIPQYDDELPSDEELREHAEVLGISVNSLREARRLEQQAIQDLLSEVVEPVKGILSRRSIQGPVEIRLLVSDSGEVSATYHRIKKWASSSESSR